MKANVAGAGNPASNVRAYLRRDPLPNLLGIYVRGVSIEEVLFAATRGAVWSVAYPGRALNPQTVRRIGQRYCP